MPASFRVRISKDNLVFSAAHFITLDDGICERLHGHNYCVAAEVAGPLGESCYVIDFILLRDLLQQIVAELDHHVLLPTAHPKILVRTIDHSVEAAFEERRWVFPSGDCALLPVPNTTAEELAQYIGRRLLDELRRRSARRDLQLRVEVDECYGQIGICELTGD